MIDSSSDVIAQADAMISALCDEGRSYEAIALSLGISVEVVIESHIRHQQVLRGDYGDTRQVMAQGDLYIERLQRALSRPDLSLDLRSVYEKMLSDARTRKIYIEVCAKQAHVDAEILHLVREEGVVTRRSCWDDGYTRARDQTSYHPCRASEALKRIG